MPPTIDADTIIQRLIGRAGQLYSLPAVGMEVLELTNNPTVDAAALKKCIEKDPALTGRLLRVVNSSLFGLPRAVSDLGQALGLLGTKPLKLLVLGFSLPVGLFEGLDGELLAHYWRHTLTKAVAGREIAETIWNEAGDEAFLAGLLQDLGVLLLVGELGPPYMRLLEKTYRDGADLSRLETQAMGFDHIELSARLLESWRLPESLIRAVRQRESDAKTPSQRTQVRIVCLAELAARLLADGRTEALAELWERGRAYHDISPEQINMLVAELQEKVHQLADVLSLQLPGALNYTDILSRAHAQLADVAFSTVLGMAADRAAADAEELAEELASLSASVARLGTKPASSAKAPTMGVKTLPAAGAKPRNVATPRWDGGPAKEVLAQLEASVAACRQSRRALSLLLLDVDGGSISPAESARIAGSMQHELMALCQELDHPFRVCRAYRATGCAVILTDCDRSTAVSLGNQLIGEIRPRLAEAQARGGHVAVGAATVSLPPKNFPAEDLFKAADRCLYGSHASGGGVVKSIEIY